MTAMTAALAALQELVGKDINVKVMEVDEERGRLMLSSKAAATAERAAAYQVRRDWGCGACSNC